MRISFKAEILAASLFLVVSLLSTSTVAQGGSSTIAAATAGQYAGTYRDTNGNTVPLTFTLDASLPQNLTSSAPFQGAGSVLVGADYSFWGSLMANDHSAMFHFLGEGSGLTTSNTAAGVVSYQGTPSFSGTYTRYPLSSLSENPTTGTWNASRLAGPVIIPGPAIIPQSGWWWNAAQGGRGYFIEVKNGRFFAASYLYDNSGNPLWYVTGPAAVNGSSSTLSGTLGAYSGGQELTGAYKPPAGPNSVGSMNITFSDSTHGTITWPGGTVPITRYDIATGSLALPDPSFKPETGWWWDASEGGRGFSIEIQGDNLFIAGYMYDASGNPVWYVSAGKMTTPTVYQGAWMQYQNGQSMGGIYKSATVKNPSVGAVAVTFTSTTTATLYLPDGTTRQLTRYSF